MVKAYRPTEADIAFLSKIYQVEPTLHAWKNLMDEFCDLCMLQSFSLAIVRPDTHTMRFHIGGGKKYDDKYIQLYLEEYFRYDLCQQYALARVDKRFHATSLISEIDNEAHGVFYTNWCRPQNIEYGATCCLFKAGPWQATLQANRGAEQPPYSEVDVDRLDFFVDTFLVALNRTLDYQKSDDVSAQQAILGCFRLPVALFDAFGYLIGTNSAFDQCMSTVDALGIQNNVLSLSSPYLDRQLKIRQLKCLMGDFGYTYNIQGDFLKDKMLGSLRLGVVPLNTFRNGEFEAVEGGLVYVVDEKLIIPPRESQLRSFFGLTRREAELCRMLSEARSVDAMAEAMGISLWTVREYISKIYRKTNTENQLQLINALASLPHIQTKMH